MNTIRVMVVLAICGVLSVGSFGADVKSDVAALVDKMPAFGANSMFEGPARADAEKVFDQILAGGAPAVVAVVDMLAPPPAQNFKPRYVLHGMAQWLGDKKLADKRRVFVGALASTLGGERPKWAQGFVARQLQTVGDGNAAPALGKLLADEELCEYAVQALSAIGGPAAAGELRKALPQAKGRCRMAIIRGLGEVRDAASAPELVKALTDADRDVRITAGLALAQIADANTIDAMLKAAEAAKTPFEQAQLTEACLQFGDALREESGYARAAKLFAHLYDGNSPVHVKCAALEGLGRFNGVKDEVAEKTILAAVKSEDRRVRIAAAQAAAMATPNKEVPLGPVKLKDAPEDVRVQYLLSLAKCQGYCARPAVDVGLNDGSLEVRKAAVRGMGLVGGRHGKLAAGDVLALIKKGDMDLFGDAMDSLRAIVAAGGLEQGEVEEEIALALPQASPQAKTALVSLLANRSAVRQLPAVLKLAVEDKDEAVRAAAIRAVGALGGKEQAATVIGWVIGAGGDALRQAAEEALVTLGRGGDGDAVATATADAAGKASGAAKLPLVRALGAMQRDAGLGVLRQHAFGADAELKEIAVRALAEWPTLAAADDLLKLARNAEPATLQVLALRGYVRLIPEAQSDEAKLTMCREGMAAAKRPDEKRMVLGVLARLPLAGAVELAAAQLDEKDLARDAAGAVIGAAKGTKELTPAARAAVQKAIDATTDKRLIGEGQKILTPAKK